MYVIHPDFANALREAIVNSRQSIPCWIALKDSDGQFLHGYFTTVEVTPGLFRACYTAAAPVAGIAMIGIYDPGTRTPWLEWPDGRTKALLTGESITVEGSYTIDASASGPTEMRQKRILDALEEIIRLDDDPRMRFAARRRYLELTDGKEPT